MYYIYLIQNIVNNKIYVGKTSNPFLRIKQHLKIINAGSSKKKETFNLIHKAVVKYGRENFNFLTIEEYELENEVLEAERFWIEFFRTNVSKFGNDCGYNLTDGGEGLSGFKHSKESKRKISLKLKGRKSPHAVSENTLKNLRPNPLDFGCKIEWPSNSDLLAMVREFGFVGTGKFLNVSNNAVKGRLKRRKLY